jgi:endogenous inhibitor of DNA gyrase (YacG/DUF329 family)|tara:strand:+ start:2135 stop:2386 length:252 start_codon:yes stop_codon:yes gene_type:complete
VKEGKNLACARIENERILRRETVHESPKKLLKCPICKKPAEKDKSKNPFLPFCSERCRTIDMGAWLDGKYVVKEGEPNPGPEY